MKEGYKEEMNSKHTTILQMKKIGRGLFTQTRVIIFVSIIDLNFKTEEEFAS